MENIDVLIVGAGPAGATCAERLRAGGLNTLIVDKASILYGGADVDLTEKLQVKVRGY